MNSIRNFTSYCSLYVHTATGFGISDLSDLEDSERITRLAPHTGKKADGMMLELTGFPALPLRWSAICEFILILVRLTRPLFNFGYATNENPLKPFQIK
jgi:hypothetical protein